MTGTLESLVKAGEDRWWQGWRNGPSRLRWEQLPPQVGDRAPELELTGMSGDRVALSSVWRERPALLIFWRHFGCGCGFERAERLVAEHPQYVAAGANVAIIGQGEPERAEDYAQRRGIPEGVTLLTDDSGRAYETYGILEGDEVQILYDAPDELLRREEDAGRALAEARRAAGRPLVDNGWQLPAEFVVDTSGTIRLTYRYNYCDNFPDPRVLTAALRLASGQV